MNETGKISCFDQSGRILKVHNLFSEDGKGLPKGTIKKVYQLGSKFLILINFRTDEPQLFTNRQQHFCTVSCDQTLSTVLLKSPKDLNEFCVPHGSNGQSCFISYQDNTFRHHLRALAIDGKKLKVLWDSPISDPHHFTASKRHVVVEEANIVSGTMARPSEVLCAMTGKKLGVVPALSGSGGGISNSMPFLRAKIIGSFLVRSWKSELDVFNLSTLRPVRRLKIPHNGLHSIHDAFFQRPGDHPTGLPLDRIHVVFTASMNFLKGTSQVMLLTLKAKKEEPKKAAAPKAESKEQSKAESNKRLKVADGT
ncbi:MAG: hypothetical protein H0X51_09745 [Parachlamydiaceae bacterium]|nr:hypothetical protein [Parachlamydiaceae bacterium]